MILGDAALSKAFATWMLTGYFQSIPRDVEEEVWVWTAAPAATASFASSCP